MKPVPIAILISDLHLQLNKPVAREEKDWMEVQADKLDRVYRLAEEHAIPVICAGDIFDRWNSPPELINFAIKFLPRVMYAVPGQHDLPLHNYDDRRKSAYWTLCMTQRIQNLYGIHGPFQGITITGFPWGVPITPCERKDNTIQIAVIHQYVWKEGCGHTLASDAQRASKLKAQLKGYDVALFGDNHKNFVEKVGDCTVFNHGCFIPRKSDERNYKPRIGILMSDGSLTFEAQDTSKDLWAPIAEAKKKESDGNMQRIISELQDLGATGLDFKEAVKRYSASKNIAKPVQDIINQLLEQDGS